VKLAPPTTVIQNRNEISFAFAGDRIKLRHERANEFSLRRRIVRLSHHSQLLGRT
jgi:hypothetical protein